MTKIMAVMDAVIEEAKCDAEQAEIREAKTEQVIRDLLMKADILAEVVFQAKNLVALMEKPLTQMADLINSNADVQLEQAQILLDDVEEALKGVRDIFGDDEDEDDEDTDTEAVGDDVYVCGAPVTVSVQSSDDAAEAFVAMLHGAVAANAQRQRAGFAIR